MKRVTDLFKGELDLIMGFNAFLPEGSKITEESLECLVPSDSDEYAEYDEYWS